jgi:hypothetical protein
MRTYEEQSGFVAAPGQARFQAVKTPAVEQVGVVRDGASAGTAV